MATPPPSLHLWGILSESKRIINAHSRHFLALSVIFLLPLSFSLIVAPTLFRLLPLSPSSSPHFHTLLQSQSQPQPQPQFHSTALLFALSFSLFLLFLSLFSRSSITHSVFHGFFGRPVKLPSAVTSIFPSFLPLLTTTLLFHLSLLFLSLPFFLLLNLTLSSSSPLFLALSAILLLSLVLLLLYFRVSWTLSSVIAVLESSYGFQPLRRSTALMKGMRGVGLSSLLFFSILEGLLVWTSSVLTMASQSDHRTPNTLFQDWASVLQIVVTSTVLMLLMLYNTAVNTVLYMYCKALHGELALEIAEEFAADYVSFPFDEQKVPHVVTVVNV